MKWNGRTLNSQKDVLDIVKNLDSEEILVFKIVYETETGQHMSTGYVPTELEEAA